jgi:hypothetical protein
MCSDTKTGVEIQGLTLFDRRAVVVHKPTTRAGQHLCRRLPIPPGQADLPSREIEVGGQAHTVVQTGPQQWDVLVFETPERAQEVINRADAIINRIATYPADQQDTLLFELNRALAARFGTASAGRGKAGA